MHELARYPAVLTDHSCSDVVKHLQPTSPRQLLSDLRITLPRPSDDAEETSQRIILSHNPWRVHAEPDEPNDVWVLGNVDQCLQLVDDGIKDHRLTRVPDVLGHGNKAAEGRALGVHLLHSHVDVMPTSPVDRPLCPPPYLLDDTELLTLDEVAV